MVPEPGTSNVLQVAPTAARGVVPTPSGSPPVVLATLDTTTPWFLGARAREALVFDNARTVGALSPEEQRP